MRVLFTIILLTSLASCTGINTHNAPVWNDVMFKGPSDGGRYPPLYITGWKHGCETGAYTSANTFYRLRYKFNQDWQLAQDDTYYKGWQDAFDYCRKYVLQHNLRTIGKKLGD